MGPEAAAVPRTNNDRISHRASRQDHLTAVEVRNREAAMRSDFGSLRSPSEDAPLGERAATTLIFGLWHRVAAFVCRVGQPVR